MLVLEGVLVIIPSGVGDGSTLWGAGGQSKGVRELGAPPGVLVEEGVAKDFSEGLGDGAGGVCAVKKKSPADFWGVSEEVFSSAEMHREG